jgi:NAD(P)-dependent dehydrogenase (short-subunit alcohol dehydrogenase family)
MSRTVLITGASRGIGRATALAAAGRGFAVAVHYRSNEAAAASVVAQLRALPGGAHRARSALSASTRESTVATRAARETLGVLGRNGEALSDRSLGASVTDPRRWLATRANGSSRGTRTQTRGWLAWWHATSRNGDIFWSSDERPAVFESLYGSSGLNLSGLATVAPTSACVASAGAVRGPSHAGDAWRVHGRVGAVGGRHGALAAARRSRRTTLVSRRTQITAPEGCRYGTDSGSLRASRTTHA